MENKPAYHKQTSKPQIIQMERGMMPPQAVDIEEAVLGALLIDSENVLDEVLMIIKTSEIFYKENHRLIFDAIKELHKNDTAIDLLTVAKQLEKTKAVETVGGYQFLVSLTQKIASSAHIEFHARILLQEHIKRSVIQIAADCMKKAYDQGTDIFDLLAMLSKETDQLNETINTGQSADTIKTSLDKLRERLVVLSTRDTNQITGVKTGIKRLDQITNGFQPTDLIIIAARPGMGKTSFILKTLLENIKANVPVGVFSVEMSCQQLVTRMVAINSHFHLNQLFRNGFEKQEYFHQYDNLQQQMESYPVYFEDKKSEIYDVIAQARIWVRKHSVKIILIDYLQLLSWNSGGKSTIREQEISFITRKLKALAKELNVPIVALSQLSRAVEERSDKRPQLKDLRESGAIEQDADLVAFLFRAGYYHLQVEDDILEAGGNSEFIIAKHRNGSLDRVALFFDENKAKYMDPSEFRDITNMQPSEAF